MKMKGISRDGGTKKYINKSSTRKRYSYKVQPTSFRPVARLIERGVHINNMWASGHTTYNLMCFKLS